MTGKPQFQTLCDDLLTCTLRYLGVDDPRRGAYVDVGSDSGKITEVIQALANITAVYINSRTDDLDLDVQLALLITDVAGRCEALSAQERSVGGHA